MSHTQIHWRIIALCGLVALFLFYTVSWTMQKGATSVSTSTESLGRVVPDLLGTPCKFRNNSSIRIEDIPIRNRGRYLMITKIPEQLSKSKFHLAELMYLARLTNRTLVLPKCRNGFLGNGLYANQSLCMYFDLGKLGEYVYWVSEELFLDRIALFKVRNKGRVPPSFTVVFKSTQHSCSRDLSASQFPEKEPSKLNLTMAALSHSGYACLNCHPASNYGSIQSYVLDRKVNSAKVLIVEKASPFKCFQYEAALPYLQYAANLESTVDQLVEQKLSPRYLSIQWRIEKLTILGMASTRDRITKCGRGLIKTAKKLSEKHNLKGVFIASDISPDNKTRSIGFDLSAETRLIVLSTIQEVYRTLRPVAWADLNEGIPNLDSGTLGILDKLACSKGHVFLYPPNWCFGRQKSSDIPSSYTREIVDIRKAHGIPSNRSQLWEI